MTSFTRIPDDERSVITFNTLHTIAKIEDNTYGGFRVSNRHPTPS